MYRPKTIYVEERLETTFMAFFCGCQAFVNHDLRSGSYHYCETHNNEVGRPALWRYTAWFVKQVVVQ